MFVRYIMRYITDDSTTATVTAATAQGCYAANIILNYKVKSRHGKFIVPKTKMCRL